MMVKQEPYMHRFVGVFSFTLLPHFVIRLVFALQIAFAVFQRCVSILSCTSTHHHQHCQRHRCWTFSKAISINLTVNLYLNVLFCIRNANQWNFLFSLVVRHVSCIFFLFVKFFVHRKLPSSIFKWQPSIVLHEHCFLYLNIDNSNKIRKKEKDEWRSRRKVTHNKLWYARAAIDTNWLYTIDQQRSK